MASAIPARWYVELPRREGDAWVMQAFGDPLNREAPISEWTAVARSEEGVVREMARCLREIAAGRVPT